MRRRFLGKPALSVAVLAVVLAATALATIAAAPPNLHRAIETQRHLAAERPQDPGVWNDLGNLLLVAGQIAEAEAAYQRAVQLDPKKVSALFNLGLLDQQRGDEEEAMRLYKRAVEADPRHAWTHYQIGTIYEKRGNKQKAIREYGEAFSLDPQLGFPEVNPEVVESNLTTEAMLHAYKHGISSGTGASRQYDDPARIAKILVQQPPQTPEEAAKAAQDAHPTVLNQSNLPPNSNIGQAAPPGQTAPKSLARPAVPNTYNPGVGYSVPGAAAPAVPGGAPQQWTRPQPRYVNPGDGTQPGNVVTPPPGGVYYRPGAQSTGQLGAVVLPQEQ